MSEPTLREQLLQTARELDLAELSSTAVRLRALAARCEPEKPGEAVALPEVLNKARAALEGIDWNHRGAFIECPSCGHPSAQNTSPEDLRRRHHEDCDLAAALSAVEAYRPEPLPQATASVISQLRDFSENIRRGYLTLDQHRIADALASLADRLSSAAPEKREALPESPYLRMRFDVLRSVVGSLPARDLGDEVVRWIDATEKALSAAVPAAPDEGQERIHDLKRLAVETAIFLSVIDNAPAGMAEADNSEVRALLAKLGFNVDDIEALEDERSALSAHADSGEGASVATEKVFRLVRAILRTNPTRGTTEGYDELLAAIAAIAPATLLELPGGEDAMRRAELIAEAEERWRRRRPAPPAPAPSAAREGKEEGDRCPNCGEFTTFAAQSSDHVERHGLDTPPYESVHQEWLECDKCGAPTDDEEIAKANAPACPVADLKEAIIGAARKAAREELATWRQKDADCSLYVEDDWRRLYAGIAMSGAFASGRTYPPSEMLELPKRWVSWADLLLNALDRMPDDSAPKPDPAPEEHVAPDTAGFTRRPER